MNDLCHICKEEVEERHAVTSTEGDTYCTDCADANEDIWVECPTCTGAGVLMGVVRSWHLSPPEVTCGNCGGDGVMPYWRSLEDPLTEEDIAAMKADMKYDELKDEGVI